MFKYFLCRWFGIGAEYIYDPYYNKDNITGKNTVIYYKRYKYCQVCNTIWTTETDCGIEKLTDSERDLLLSKIHKEYVKELHKEVHIIKENL